MNHLARKNPLGAVSDLNIGIFTRMLRKTEVWAHLCEPCGHFFGCAHGRGGFQDHQIAFRKDRSDRIGGRLDVAEIGLVAVHERRRNSNQEGICRFGLGGGTEIAFVHGGVNEDVQLWLYNMDSAAVDRVHSMLGNIYANDTNFARGEEGGGWQADVAKANHGHSLKHRSFGRRGWGECFNGVMIVSPLRSGKFLGFERCVCWPSRRRTGCVLWTLLEMPTHRRVSGMFPERCRSCLCRPV